MGNQLLSQFTGMGEPGVPPAASDLEGRAQQEKPSWQDRGRGDGVGQKGVPGLVWLWAGPHAKASSSVEHPRGVIMVFPHTQLVGIWVEC